MRPVLILAELISAAAAMGQDESVFKVDSRLVVVHATVRDRKGRHLGGLSKDQFEVRDNGQVRPILTFESDAGSLSCAILLDTTASMTQVLPSVKKSVIQMLQEFRPEDSVAIYSFSDRIQPLQDFTKDKGIAAAALVRMRARGGTALFDALVELVREIEPRSGKKAIIVFTDGGDNASLLTAHTAIRRANLAGIPVYAIAEGAALKSTVVYEQLKEISARTGARSFQAHSGTEIAAVFRQVSRDLRHTYMLTYKPPPSGDARWREIELSVPGSKDIRILARRGYYPQ